jgi:hypothetical protein
LPSSCSIRRAQACPSRPSTRKMDKLMHMLGECVPGELVFPGLLLAYLHSKFCVLPLRVPARATCPRRVSPAALTSPLPHPPRSCRSPTLTNLSPRAAGNDWKTPLLRAADVPRCAPEAPREPLQSARTRAHSCSAAHTCAPAVSRARVPPDIPAALRTCGGVPPSVAAAPRAQGRLCAAVARGLADAPPHLQAPQGCGRARRRRCHSRGCHALEAAPTVVRSESAHCAACVARCLSEHAHSRSQLVACPDSPFVSLVLLWHGAARAAGAARAPA